MGDQLTGVLAQNAGRRDAPEGEGRGIGCAHGDHRHFDGPSPLGATDAAAFTLAGIPSTCILCQDTSKLVPHYHTRLDTAEKVRPESLSVTLQLVIDMIQRIDEPEEPE